MDGVIINSNPTHLTSWKSYLKNNRIEASDEDLRNHMFGKSNSYIVKYFFKKEFSKEELQKMQTEKEALFREEFKETFESVPGIEVFMEELLANNVKLGIATSAPMANMQLTMSKLPVTAKVHSKMAEEDVEHHKPHPEVYLKSAINIGLEPSKCIVFEDSSSGITAGKAAGMKVVGVLTSFSKEELPPCDAYIKDFSEINFAFCLELTENS